MSRVVPLLSPLPTRAHGLAVTAVLGERTPAMVAGDAPPPPRVLFVHGHASSKETWHSVLARPAPLGFDAAAVDLPGYGESPVPWDLGAEGYAIDRVCDALLGVLHALGWLPAAARAGSSSSSSSARAPPLFLCGHSMGGRVVVPLALRLPHVAGVVIEDMDMHVWSAADSPGLPPTTRAAERARMQAFEQMQPSAKAAAAALESFGFDHERVQGWLRDGRLRPQPGGAVWCGIHPWVCEQSLRDLLASPASGFGAFEELSARSTPTLLLVASEKDTVTKPAAVAEMQRAMPALRRIDVSGAGHSIHKTHTAEFCTALDTFIRDHSGGAAAAPDGPK